MKPKRNSKVAFLWLACFVASAAAALHAAPPMRAAPALPGAHALPGTRVRLGAAGISGAPALPTLPAGRLKSMAVTGQGGCYAATPSPTGAAPQVLLPVTQQGVDGTTSQTLNVTLPGGFRLFGMISGGTATSISAQGSDGTIYFGRINSATSSYAIGVKSDTYMLTVCYQNNFMTTFFDPAAVTVAADTQHDIALSPPVAWNVGGSIAGASPFGSSALLASSDSSTGAVASVGFDGSFSVRVPDGTYSVALTQFSFLTGGTYTVIVGTVVVSGGDVTASFTVPPTNTLSGAVSMMDGTSVPGNSAVIATDSSATPSTGCFSQLHAFGFGPIDSSSGAYQQTLANGVTFQVLAELMTNPTPDVGLLLFNAGMVTMTTDTTMNITVESQPGVVTLGGQVTDPNGNGVQNVTVTATSNQVTGAPNSIYARTTTTDTNGMFSFTVENGANYTVSFNPTSPMP